MLLFFSLAGSIFYGNVSVFEFDAAMIESGSSRVNELIFTQRRVIYGLDDVKRLTKKKKKGRCTEKKEKKKRELRHEVKYLEYRRRLFMRFPPQPPKDREFSWLHFFFLDFFMGISLGHLPRMLFSSTIHGCPQRYPTYLYLLLLLLLLLVLLLSIHAHFSSYC